MAADQKWKKSQRRSKNMIDYHPYSDQIKDDPYPVYQTLRDEDPVHFMDEYNTYFVTRFDDIWKLGPNSKNLSTKNGTTPGHLLVNDMPPTLSFNQMDPPRHSKQRAFMNRHFLPKTAAQIEERMRPYARELLDELIERGEGDLLREYAARIAVRGACTVAGLPLDIEDKGVRWVNDIFSREDGHNGQTAAGMTAAVEMFQFCMDYVKEMRERADRATGALYSMLNEEVEGEKMNDFRIASTLAMILIGGSDTFPKAFGATLKRMWENPDERKLVADDPELCQDAFLEALRIDTPTQMLGRTCTLEFEFGDKTIQPGQNVMFLWAAANRDEREFDAPSDYRILRRPKRMLAFGHGVHMCIGHHVAKMEARVGLQELMRRVPEYELDMSRARRLRTEFVQGWTELPAELRPS